MYNDSLDPIKNAIIVETMANDIKNSGIEFDFIAFRGSSGALIGAPISLALKKRLVNIRKEDAPAHSGTVTGLATGRYIIVDDFICTGSTIEFIFDALGKEFCVRIFVSCKHCWSGDTWNGTPVRFSKCGVEPNKDY